MNENTHKFNKSNLNKVQGIDFSMWENFVSLDIDFFNLEELLNSKLKKQINTDINLNLETYSDEFDRILNEELYNK